MFESLKVVFSAVAAVALLGFSVITLGITGIGLAISTPIFLIFSPVLVPATIATTILATGFTATGTFAATALSILMWIYKMYTGSNAPKIPGVNPKKKDDKEYY